MKGSPEVITTLQAALPLEAHLNMQCRNYQRQLKDMGIKKIAKKVKHIGDDAHCFQKKITNRLLFFGASIGYSMPAIVDGNLTVTAVLQNILDMEMGAITPFERNIQIAMAALDDTSRNLWEHLLKWHEDNVEWLEQQLALIQSIGEAEYIAEYL